MVQRPRQARSSGAVWLIARVEPAKAERRRIDELVAHADRQT
jgi:hypothetical protein